MDEVKNKQTKTLLLYCCEILTGRGSCHSGGLRNFRSDKNAEQWQCCTTVRPADTLILPPHTIQWYTAANQLPILFPPPDDIASRRFVSIS